MLVVGGLRMEVLVRYRIGSFAVTQPITYVHSLAHHRFQPHTVNEHHKLPVGIRTDSGVRIQRGARRLL